MLKAFAGSFIKSVTPAPTTQDVTGIGFQPTALILFTSGGTLGAGAIVRGCFGLCDSVLNQQSSSYSVRNGQTIAGAANARGATRDNTRALVLVDPALGLTPAAIAARASVSSMLADGFRLSWDVNDLTTSRVHFIALGGDLRSALLAYTLPTVTGNVVVTGAGFRPEAVVHVFGGTSGVGSNEYEVILGVATRHAEQWALDSIMQEDVFNPDTANGQEFFRTDHCVTITRTQGANAAHRAEHVSMDTDGFTINQTFVGPLALAESMRALCLSSIDAAAPDFAKVASPASTQTLGPVFFQPRVVLLAGYTVSAATPSSSSVDISLTHGASTGGSVQEASFAFDQDGGGGPTPVAVAAQYESITEAFLYTSTVPPPVEALATVSLQARDVTLTWVPNSANAARIGALILGDRPLDRMRDGLGL